MTPWILGFPLVVLALVFAALVWENHREHHYERYLNKLRRQERRRTAPDRISEGIRETLEDIGILDVGGSPRGTAGSDEGPSGSSPGLVDETETMKVVSPETHPTLVAGPQEGTLPPPPAAAMRTGLS